MIEHEPIIEFKKKSKPEVPFLLESNSVEKPSFFLSGEIERSTPVEVLNWLGHWGQEDPTKQLTVFIDSVGGDLVSSVTIAEAFQISPNKIRTIAVGRCYSGGCLIMAAGDKGERYAWPKADFMIHQVSLNGSINETTSELEETTKQTKRWNNTMIKMLAEFTGQTPSQIKFDIRKDKYMTAEEARRYGLVDQIIIYPKK